MPDTMIVLDGNSLINRAFFGLKANMTAPDGFPTNAVYGFMNMLHKLMINHQPVYAAVAFDVHEPTFRHRMYDAYKAGRKPAPEELKLQFPVVKQLLNDLKIPVVECPGYEADDILGTLSAECERRGIRCILCTGDRDSYQLIGENTWVDYANQGPEADVYTPERILEKYGVSPIELIQVKALMGDSSDNIPGVPGIGEKTALGLISEYKTVENLYAHLGDGAFKPSVLRKLEEGRESSVLSLKLAEIDRKAPICTDPEAYRIPEADGASLAGHLSTLGMFRMMETFGVAGLAKEEPKEESGVSDAGIILRQVTPEELTQASCLLLLQEESACLIAAESEEGWNWAELSLFPAPVLEKLLALPMKVHNAKAAAALCGEQELPAPKLLFSTELAGYLLNPSATSYAPGVLGTVYGIPFGESPEEKIKGFIRLTEALEKKVTEEGLDKILREIELPLALVLADMEKVGFRADREGIRAFGEKLSADIERLTASIYEQAGEVFNINSPKQLGEILFEKMQLPGKKKTKTGYSTNVDVLNALRPVAPIVNDILEYRSLSKLKSTYVEGLLKEIGPDGRIRSSFNQTEARTGRISSSEPNLQNIPVRTPLGREMRRFFVADPGYVLLDADYSQIELRVLAAIAKDEAMSEAFLSGEDIHTRTASQVFGLPPELITSELRRRAKAVNFGIVYGISAHSLSEDLNVSYSEASRYIQDYLRTFSGVERYMRETVEQAKETGTVTTLFGRKREIPELKAKNAALRAFGERAAMNTPIQGTAADIIKLAMIRVHDRLEKSRLKARLILQVHDELMVEAPLEEAAEAMDILREEMENAVHLSVPMEVDIHSGPDWYTAKG